MSDPLLSRIRHVLDAFENDGVTLSLEATQRIMLESDEIPIQLREQRAGRIISVSKSVNMEATARLFSLEFGRWDSPSAPSEAGLSESAGKLFPIPAYLLGGHHARSLPYLSQEHVIQEMCKFLFSGKHGSAFPRGSTLMHVIICDILSAYTPALAKRNVEVTGNYPIITQLPQNKGIITGKPDMFIAYACRKWFLEKLDERTTAVILQTKKRPQPYDVRAQAVAYMVGMHQKRTLLSPNGAEERATYGILSDGVEWQFMRLFANVIEKSRVFSVKEDEDQGLIYRYVHDIVKDSIDQAPIANDTAA